jgi:hypothetical protein
MAVCALVLTLSSCINERNTRFPTVFNYGPEYERAQAAVQDPYPDSIAGPDTGFRPNEFHQERPEPDRVRDRWTATRMRQDYQRMNGGQQPLFAPTTMFPNPYLVPAPMTAQPYPPFAPYAATVPIGPMASGPFWMPYPQPVVSQPILVQPLQ